MRWAVPWRISVADRWLRPSRRCASRPSRFLFTGNGNTTSYQLEVAKLLDNRTIDTSLSPPVY
jgi:hypothetical protein